jgi:BirA family transcriptional regulator, biotin operon repressor / biotin---[acetyl-CoA-carboxylase] ligase
MPRALLDSRWLTGELGPAGFDVRVLEITGSTNADLVAEARAGAPAGLVLVAERQSAGRGRQGRVWASPAGDGLTFSLLLRPAVPAPRLGWLPLLAGLAVVDALAETCGLAARLKWPNDVLVDGRKVAGLLAEAVPGAGGPPAVVLGVGLNVTTAQDDLPPGATSLDLALRPSRRPVPRREHLLAAFLRALTARQAGWAAGAADDATAAYTAASATLGQLVRLELPAGGSVIGLASALDADGRLVVDGHAYSAGDVVHLRPAAGPAAGPATG